ncbi:MAG TPA: protease modulator HflK, partial [Oxalicibacterium sp.]|nr:protease modulator HflK [Oxalicibacterium sp.]
MLVTLFKKLGLKFSLNDPRWGRGSDDNNKNQNGKKPNEGPPDLDQ